MKQGVIRYGTLYTSKFYKLSPHKPTTPENRQICTYSTTSRWTCPLQLLLAAKSALFIVLCDCLTGPEVEPVHNSLDVFSLVLDSKRKTWREMRWQGFYYFFVQWKNRVLQMPTVRRGSWFFRFNSSFLYCSCHVEFFYKQLLFGMAKPDSTSWSIHRKKG